MAEAVLRDVRCVPDDAHLVLDWRNDPVTRAVSFDDSMRDWDEFWRGFRDRYPDQGLPRPQFLEVEGSPVAYLRFDPPRAEAECERDTTEVSINVDPARRGRGLGRQALKLAEDYLASFGCRRILAAVKADNVVSGRLFEGAGYQDTGRFQFVPHGAEDSVDVIRFIREISQSLTKQDG